MIAITYCVNLLKNWIDLDKTWQTGGGSGKRKPVRFGGITPEAQGKGSKANHHFREVCYAPFWSLPLYRAAFYKNRQEHVNSIEAEFLKFSTKGSIFHKIAF